MRKNFFIVINMNIRVRDIFTGVVVIFCVTRGSHDGRRGGILQLHWRDIILSNTTGAAIATGYERSPRVKNEHAGLPTWACESREGNVVIAYAEVQ